MTDFKVNLTSPKDLQLMTSYMYMLVAHFNPIELIINEMEALCRGLTLKKQSKLKCVTIKRSRPYDFI